MGFLFGCFCFVVFKHWGVVSIHFTSVKLQMWGVRLE